MSDTGNTDAPSIAASWTARLWFSAITMVCAFSMIAALLVYGQSANLLHQTALSSGFYIVFAILAGLGASALIGPITDILRKP